MFSELNSTVGEYTIEVNAYFTDYPHWHNVSEFYVINVEKPPVVFIPIFDVDNQTDSGSSKPDFGDDSDFAGV